MRLHLRLHQRRGLQVRARQKKFDAAAIAPATATEPADDGAFAAALPGAETAAVPAAAPA